MPNYDGTGPEGKGPMTGLGRGYCIIPISKSNREFELLKNQARVLQSQLKQINSRKENGQNKKEVHHAGI